MSCGCTFDELEELATQANNISSDEHRAARAARVKVVGFA